MASRADLRTQQRLNGIVTTALLLAMAAYGLAVGYLDDVGFVVVVAVAAAILVSMFIARYARFGMLPRKSRFRDLLIRDHEFVAPGISTSSWSAPLLVLFVLAESLHRSESSLVFFVIIGVGLVLAAAALTIIRLRSGPRSVILTPTGFGVRTLFGRRWFAWDGHFSVTVERGPVVIFGHSSRDLELWSELVNPDFLAAALNHYRDDPNGRAAIGTEPELERLRLLAVPAPPRSAKTAFASTSMPDFRDPNLTSAVTDVIESGVGLDEKGVLAVLNLPDDEIPAALEAAHQVRMKWCGPEVEVEGIVSLKTGGCPEDCHFCSQSGLFTSPVRAVWLDIPALVEAARQTAATGATEFCIVAAVRGPDARLMDQMRDGVKAIKEAVDIQVAASLGMLSQEQVDELVEMGVHRYNHNLETAQSFFTNVVTTHTWEERFETLRMVRESGMEVCCGGILGLGETIEQRAEFAMQLAALDPHEVPLNFLNPRPGTPLADNTVVDPRDALRAIAAFRLALPRTILRFAGGREITLGDLGTRDGLLGGINAVIVGNYLTTLGRPATSDLDLLEELKMPVKALSATL